MEVRRGPCDDVCQQSPMGKKEPSSVWGLSLSKESLPGEMEKGSLSP